MSIDLKITPITADNYDRERLAPLLKKSLAEGYNLVLRLCEDWESGKTRFDQPGEAFFGIEQDGRLIGVGGRSIDPYVGDPAVLRIRHVYLLPEWRQIGIGARLMKKILDLPPGDFRRITLRTLHPGARKFYESLGFNYLGEGEITHDMALAPAKEAK